MQIEIIVIGIIVFLIMSLGGQIKINQMISDNQMLFLRFKESDWDFSVSANYGNNINPDYLYNKRIKNALLVMILVFFFMIQDINAVKVLIILVVSILIFKMPYNDIKKFYNQHMHQIDSMLPHYLKNLE